MQMARPWIALTVILCSSAVAGAPLSPDQPTWWSKFQRLSAQGAIPGGGRTASVAGPNAGVSNECGPQSETYVTLNPAHPSTLTGGSNEIFRLPMRAYFSSDGGGSWGGVDVPLPPPLSGANDTRFGSDPTLAFDTQGNVFYGFIVVFFSANFAGINGTEMAVARSTDGGKTWPLLTEFSFEPGENHFNDKPMIAADTSARSPFRDNVYIAWDAAVGGSSGGGIRFGRSTDHGVTFSVVRIDHPTGPGRGIGAIPFLGPNGEVYAAWNDFAANTIAFNRSFDGGVTWDTPGVIAAKQIPFQALIPAQSFRGALVYPSCDADRSGGKHDGRLVCSWMDFNAAGNTDIFTAFSDDQGSTWSAPIPATDRLGGVDRFNQWLSVDPITGNVGVSFYDTRNDTTGARFMTDVFFAKSTGGGASWLANVRVSSTSSNEHDCNGLFPCPSIDYGNQYGDYEGLVFFGGVAHPIWTDSRRNQSGTATCGPRGLMEEVFSAAVGR